MNKGYEICLNCKKRYLGCHDHCEDFKAIKQAKQDRKETIWKAKASNIYDSYKIDAIRKSNQRYQKNKH